MTRRFASFLNVFFSGRTCEFTALIGVVQARAGCDEQWLVRQIAAETQRGRQELERRSQLPTGGRRSGIDDSGICQWSLYFPIFCVAQHHLLDGNILFVEVSGALAPRGSKKGAKS